MRSGRLLSVAAALASAAFLALGPAASASASPLLGIPVGAAFPSVPINVAGFEIGTSAQGAAFAGTATLDQPGAAAGTWSATVALPPVNPLGPLPPSLSMSGGTLTLSALGQAFTVSVAPATLTLLGNATPASSASASAPSCAESGGASSSTASGTTASSAAASSSSTSGTAASGSGASTAAASGASSCTAGATPPPVAPVSLGAAEEMLQVYSAAWHAAQGDPTAQQQVAAEGQALEAAAPPLSILGSFPFPASQVIWPPRVLNPAWTADCGDAAYAVSMKLSLGAIAGGSFQGQLIVYRAPTQTGCASYAMAITGLLGVTSAILGGGS